ARQAAPARRPSACRRDRSSDLTKAAPPRPRTRLSPTERLDTGKRADLGSDFDEPGARATATVARRRSSMAKYGQLKKSRYGFTMPVTAPAVQSPPFY